MAKIAEKHYGCDEEGFLEVGVDYNLEERHRHPQKEDWKQVKWCRELDGKNILALVMLKPQMTYAEIKNVIVNEGGSVDSQGIIHRD